MSSAPAVDKAEIAGLVERLRQATGPDRELDGDVWRSVMAGADRPALYGPVPLLTSSIDAALALVERLLPGADWSVSTFDENGAEGWFEGQVDRHIRQAKTPVLALLIALLTALGASK